MNCSYRPLSSYHRLDYDVKHTDGHRSTPIKKNPRSSAFIRVPAILTALNQTNLYEKTHC
jgi:hypothetical protein